MIHSESVSFKHLIECTRPWLTSISRQFYLRFVPGNPLQAMLRYGHFSELQSCNPQSTCSTIKALYDLIFITCTISYHMHKLSYSITWDIKEIYTIKFADFCEVSKFITASSSPMRRWTFHFIFINFLKTFKIF